MNGKNHALFGTAAYGITLAVGVTSFDQPAVNAGQLLAGAAVAVGASLAADADEGNSTASRGLGPIAGLIRVFSGGHRGRTHSLLVAVVLGAACAVAIRGGGQGWIYAGLCAFMVAAGVPMISRSLLNMRAGAIVSVLAGLGTLAVIRGGSIEAGWWLYAAIVAPYIAHLIGDSITPMGVPWLRPLSSYMFGIGLIKSGGAAEKMFIGPLLLALNIVAFYMIVRSGNLISSASLPAWIRPASTTPP